MRLTLHEWLSAGPFTLAMSSGFFGFFAHAGVACALEAAGFTPHCATGSSAGSIVAASWAAGMAPASLARELSRLEFRDFFDVQLSAERSNGALFCRLLQAVIPVETFEQCQFPARISVLDLASRRTRVIASGALLPAVAASCAVPLLLPPVRSAGSWWIDGGLLDRPALGGVPLGERVLYHHLISRVPNARLATALGRGVPRRVDLVSLVFDAVPRSSPFQLAAARRALEVAQRETELALERPIDTGVVRG